MKKLAPRNRHGFNFCEYVACLVLRPVADTFQRTYVLISLQQQVPVVVLHRLHDCILPSKRPWALEIYGPQNGGGHLHEKSVCVYNT